MIATRVQRSEGDSEGKPGAESGELRVEVEMGAIGATEGDYRDPSRCRREAEDRAGGEKAGRKMNVEGQECRSRRSMDINYREPRVHPATAEFISSPDPSDETHVVAPARPAHGPLSLYGAF